jgi:hypothetical protein
MTPSVCEIYKEKEQILYVQSSTVLSVCSSNCTCKLVCTFAFYNYQHNKTIANDRLIIL